MAVKRKTNKNNKRTKSMGNMMHIKTTIDGIKFDSLTESRYYEFLKELKSSKKIKDFSLQPEFILQHKCFNYLGKLITNANEEEYKEYDKLRKKYNKSNPDNQISIVNAIKYKSDFEIIYNDNTKKIVDVKGLKTTDFKIKEKMFFYMYPELTLECICWDYKEESWVEYDEYQKIVKERKKNKSKAAINKNK